MTFIDLAHKQEIWFFFNAKCMLSEVFMRLEMLIALCGLCWFTVNCARSSSFRPNELRSTREQQWISRNNRICFNERRMLIATRRSAKSADERGNTIPYSCNEDSESEGDQQKESTCLAWNWVSAKIERMRCGKKECDSKNPSKQIKSIENASGLNSFGIMRDGNLSE